MMMSDAGRRNLHYHQSVLNFYIQVQFERCNPLDNVSDSSGSVTQIEQTIMTDEFN